MLPRVMPRPVIVVDYDPAWPDQFEELRRVLTAALGDVAMRIEHVGSTSVPGLAAKPILDIDVVIESREMLTEAINRLNSLGYRHEGDLGVRGREAFDSGEHEFHEVPLDGSGRMWPRHHLYVCARDSRELARQLAFRDWLRGHEEDRVRYADLKRGLAEIFRDDRDAYCDAKRGLVESVLTKATGVGFCTARTVIRPFAVDDVPHAHPVFSNPEVMRFAVGAPDADLSATEERIQRYIAIQDEHGFSKWAVWDQTSGAYLGDAGLTVLPGTGEIELGYRVDRKHWGRGLATEVARAWLHHALDDLNLDRIIAFADPRNPASIRVMEKIGMNFDREDHLAGIDCVVYESGGALGDSSRRARRGRFGEGRSP